MTSSAAVPPSIPPTSKDNAERQFFAKGKDGTRLYVRTKDHPASDGRGGRKAPRAVFCDGILCDGFIWKYQWNDLAPHMSLSHWNYRGHGRSGSPVDANALDIVTHAHDLAAVVNEVDGGPVVVVGHSMGVQVALEFYRHYPEKVSALILECGSFGRVTSTFHGLPILELILPKLLDAALKAPDMVRAIWSRIPAETALKVAMMAKEIDPSRINPEDMLPYLRHMTHVDFPMFLRMLKAAGDHTASDMLSQVKVPTLVIAGERDTFTPAFLAESMSQAIAGSDLLIVTPGSHVAPIEQPELVRDTIVNFLNKHHLTLAAI